MNEFGTNYNRTVCQRMEMVEAMVEELRKDLARFGENPNTGFTDYDRNALAYSMEETGEAIGCLHRSLLNMKRLLG